MAYLDIESSSIYFEEHGKGKPLVLIAGLASDSQSWLPVIDKLSKYFRVIIFDSRGLGCSSKDNSDISVRAMADDCIKLIRHLKLSSVYLLGHSMGGMIAMDMAIRYPGMVDKLVLEATTPRMNNRNAELLNDWVSYLKTGMDKSLWFKNIFYWVFSSDFFEDKEILAQAINMSVNYPYPQSDESFENQVKAISSFDCVSELNMIQAQTLIIYGEEDILFPPSETVKLFKRIPGAQTITISKVAHSIHMENPDEFMECVIGFCN